MLVPKYCFVTEAYCVWTIERPDVEPATCYRKSITEITAPPSHRNTCGTAGRITEAHGFLLHEKLHLDLNLVLPVPDGTLGDEISQPVSIVGSSPCQVRFILCRSSLNDVRQVICGRPLVLRSDSGIQVMATQAGLTSGNRSTWPANLSLPVCAISDRACIPDLLINSSLVTRSCHDSPRIFRIYQRWNTKC